MVSTRHSHGHQALQRGLRPGSAERDLLMLGIVTAAILLFVGTGGAALSRAVASLMGTGAAPGWWMITALLLNVALIIFSWRRYRQAASESHKRCAAEEQARLLGGTDVLTGCLNRSSMIAAIDHLSETALGKDQGVAVIALELDDFKQINDLRGHSAGDSVLVECARRMADLLPGGTPIARLGGGQFACAVLFDQRRPDMVDGIAASLAERLSATLDIDGLPLHLSISAGLAKAPGTAADVLHRAEVAMYHARKQGKGHTCWFESPMDDELRFRNEIEAGIRRGIALGEFVPFYEQQIDLETGKLTGFEMLARWRCPVLGDVGPDVFIPIAEEIGVIAPLSESVIAQALEDAKAWDPSLTLAVNISPLQLRDPWFAQKLLKMLVAANFPPQRLEIEITESCLHENIGVVRSLIASLKNQGIRVSLDDFGTGYSSLAQLRALSFDRIKIDRSFVTSLPENTDSAAIVNAIALLGQGLGLPITVEGIENENVLAALRQYGDIKGQGYLYGQPQPASATLDRLAGMNLLQAQPARPAATARKRSSSPKQRARIA